MKTTLLCLVLLAQVNQAIDIHLNDGREVTGHLVSIYTIGLRCQNAAGTPFFIPYSDLPADWQAKCAQSKHHSVTDLSTSMQDL
ncbi:MAG TPA: hypothetical protein VHY09_12090 [Candidatus Methylacidiphilales bacterium]|jgi:hypothetical protein|nr:hypothetical protein [Candidatus Methylacidiphilales bacterium]